ncbi:MAG TPA: hypothetical protein VMY35_19200 [Phycisphaerae bacterium]|nr:hypothetical protein [Phycisphaerae bacterium]
MRDHRSKAEDFIKPLCETLKGYAFLSKRNAPPWLLDPDLSDDQKNAAAVACVWLVEWVHPVLDTISSDADAQAVIINALPEPRLPKKPAKDDRSRRLSEAGLWAVLCAEWKQKSQYDAIFLWGVWGLWKDLVGEGFVYRLGRGLPSAPPPPSHRVLSQKQREQFLAVTETGLTQMFAHDAKGFVGEAISALRWLLAATGAPTRHPFGRLRGLIDRAIEHEPPAKDFRKPTVCKMRRNRKAKLVLAGTPAEEPDTQRPPREVPEYLRAAHAAFEQVMEKCPRDKFPKSDKVRYTEAMHQWARDNCEGVHPNFGTWKRYIRDYERLAKGPKNSPRSGRTGHSIVTPDAT